MERFYVASIPEVKLSTGTSAQLIEQLLSDLSMLEGIELHSSGDEPFLCG